MKRSINFPGKYIQGRGVLSESGTYIEALGKKPVLIWGKRTREAVKATVEESFSKSALQFNDVLFNGECTKEEVERISEYVKKTGGDVIVGLGGGKVMDTARGVAALTNLPLAVIPTISSNDAPTSAVTVWYNDKGEMTGYDLWSFNPNLIMVDTDVIVKAPVKTFISGIGDALATWPEANAAYKSRAVAVAGGVATMTALAMARLCFETILEYGEEAIEAVKNRVVTPAVEKVVEATVLMSGVGWESGGLATAHSIGNTLPMFHETHEFMHGEKVSFGLLTQLCLEEDLETDEINEIVDFMVRAGLPVTLADLKIDKSEKERLIKYTEAVVGGSFVQNHNFEVDAAGLYNAMIAADGLGERRKNLLSR